MHWLDSLRHFLFLQVHPGNWFGNIVAGVVVYLVIDVCWHLFAKKLVTKFVRKIHAEEIERHHREVVKPEADARHAEAMEKADAHHEAHMTEIKKTARRAKSQTATKEIP